MAINGLVSFSLLAVILCSILVAGARETQSLTNVGGSGITSGTGPRSGLVLSPRAARYRARLASGPPERFVIEDDDIIELSKKQLDDYGHLRFGKREDQFDDYGHLRFGRGDVD